MLPEIDYSADASEVMWRSSGQGAFYQSEVQSRGLPYSVEMPGAALREASSVADIGLWMSIGEAWSQVAIAFSTTPTPRIVDIGCGCGKMARFFLTNPRVHYIGIDIFKPAIAWAEKAFSRFKNYEFKHLDVKSELYNSTGTLDGATVRLPVESRSADLIICGSLFTHLLEPAFYHYMGEIRRCLSRGGRAVISIHNEPADGARFSGQETRIDVSDAYFREIVRLCDLAVLEHVGEVFTQEIYIIERSKIAKSPIKQILRRLRLI